MRIKNIIITLWFEKFDSLKEMSDTVNENLKMYFPVCQFTSLPADLDPTIPRITGQSGSGHSTFLMSTVNARIATKYDMNFSEDYDKCFEYIEERVKKLYELLNEKNVSVIYSAIFINLEKDAVNPINQIRKSLINKSIKNDNLNEIGMRMVSIDENNFYKIIAINNSRDYTIQKELKTGDNTIIFPLISLKDAQITNECISISYELNDKYSFDNKENYNNSMETLNKMLKKAKEDIKSNIEKLIEEKEN